MDKQIFLAKVNFSDFIIPRKITTILSKLSAIFSFS
jgi:hypothetical protein